AAALEGELLEAIEVAGRMHALECLSGCRSRLAPLDGGRHVGRTQRLEHRDDALGALGMARAGVVTLASGVEEDRNGHRTRRVCASAQCSAGAQHSVM